jgi:hypothetical protein
MMRGSWRGQLGLTIAILGLAVFTGCRSTATTRKGVTSIESAAAMKPENAAETVTSSKSDANTIVPVSWNSPASGGECSH